MAAFTVTNPPVQLAGLPRSDFAGATERAAAIPSGVVRTVKESPAAVAVVVATRAITIAAAGPGHLVFSDSALIDDVSATRLPS